MWRLFSAYYAAVERRVFESDLSAKTDVILLSDAETGSLQGFSTLQHFVRRLDGRRVAVLYSGDTIVSQAYWGQTALQRAWLRYAMSCWLRHPLLDLYWFLITKGYKTYLLLTRNFPVHWPRWNRPTPAWEQALLDRLAGEKFPLDYRSDRGVVQHPHTTGRLRDDVAPIDPQLLRYPDVAFFQRRNPGHPAGDELCCLGKIDWWLCASYVLKLGRRQWSRQRQR